MNIFLKLKLHSFSLLKAHNVASTAKIIFTIVQSPRRCLYSSVHTPNNAASSDHLRCQPDWSSSLFNYLNNLICRTYVVLLIFWFFFFDFLIEWRAWCCLGSHTFHIKRSYSINSACCRLLFFEVYKTAFCFFLFLLQLSLNYFLACCYSLPIQRHGHLRLSIIWSDIGTLYRIEQGKSDIPYNTMFINFIKDINSCAFTKAWPVACDILMTIVARMVWI